MQKTKKFVKLLLALTFIICGRATSQRNCGSDKYYQNIINTYPELKERYGFLRREIFRNITGPVEIPVVVHIVYNQSQQNTTDEDVQLQIDLLNLDFGGTNKDIFNVPEPFKQNISGDCQVKFTLAGITRTHTDKPYFETDFHINGGVDPSNEAIKFTNFGGVNGEPCSQYLNIWVGAIREKGGGENSLAGYASFPGGPCEYDGVVINYTCFGKLHATDHFNKGRSVTHETGHWLNLRHIWGDALCGDDLIDDTPTQEKSNFYCPPFPHISCNNGPNGDMFMNYMDYVNDECMFMFTKLQKDRMRANFSDIRLRGSFVSNTQHANLLSEGMSREIIFPSIKKVIQTANNIVANWRSSEHNQYYIVQLKEVKARTWDTITTKENKIKAEGLKPNTLYEIKIVSMFGNAISAEGAPYLFITNKNYFVPGKNLKLINDF